MRVVALDTESQTTGNGPRPYQGDRCTVVSVADETGGRALRPEDARAEVTRLVADPDVLFVMHNSCYDRAVLNVTFGLEIPDHRIYDTQTGDWLLDENADHRLKSIGAREFGLDATAEARALAAVKRGRTVDEVYREMRAEEREKPRGEQEKASLTLERAKIAASKTQKSWATFTFEDLEAYAIQDAILTRDLYHLQQIKFEDDGFVKDALEREHRNASLAYRMTRTGIRVDPDKAGRELAIAESRMAALEAQYPDTDIGSSAQLASLIYDTWGLPLGRTTPKGARSTDKYALAALAYDSRIRELQEYKTLLKQVSAYYRPLLGHTGADGRIHPSFNAHRTVTGRWSCSEPNLQTIPRQSTSAEIRKVFVPEPGMALTEFDLSQIEVRLAAEVANEPVLLDIYKHGGDVYQDLATSILCTTTCPGGKCPVHRPIAKTVILSAQYGIGKKKLALDLSANTGRRWSEAEAAAILRAFWQKYPRLNRLMRGLTGLAEKHGFIPLAAPGRRRLYRSPHLPWPKYYSALNAKIQGDAATLLQNIAFEFEPAIVGAGRLVLAVHDSLVIEHEPGEEDALFKTLETITRDVSPYSVETPWEMKPWQ